MLNIPNKIQKNDCIGVTATSAGLEDIAGLNKLENAIKNLREFGFYIKETPNVRACEKLVSSSGKIRAEEFLELWKDEEVKYIILARGGEFLMEMLPYIDKDIIKSCTFKWVQGFSDSSLLLFYLTTNFNIPTIHANNFSAYGMRNLHESMIRSLNFVQSPNKKLVQNNFEMYEKYSINREAGKELESYNLTEKVFYKNLYKNNSEKFSGYLLGGCLDVLKVIIGTPYDNVKNFCNQFDDGIIWFLENCEMPLPELYRTLWHMKFSGWFLNAKGVLIGRTRADESVGEFNYEDALHSVFDDLKVPVIYNVDFGHVMPQLTLINGGFADFSYEEGNGKIEITFRDAPFSSSY